MTPDSFAERPLRPPSDEAIAAGLPPDAATSDVAAPVEFEPAKPPRSDSLFGREFHEHGGHPLIACLAVVAAFFVQVVIGGEANAAIVAIPPFAILLAACLRGIIFPLRYRLTAVGIEIGRRRRLVPYQSIQEVFAVNPSQSRPFPIYLLLEDDCIILPPRLSIPSAELLKFLDSQPLGARSLAAVPPRFEKFLRQQRSVAAPEDIYVFRGAPRRVTPPVRRFRRGLWWLLALAGLWFATMPFVRNPALPVSFAMGALLFALILLFAGHTRLRFAHARIKNWDEVVLIISPVALALSQGDLLGELRWNELTGVSNHGIHFRTPEYLSALNLKVQGAAIMLADVYQWPLDCAAHLIRKHSGK